MNGPKRLEHSAAGDCNISHDNSVEILLLNKPGTESLNQSETSATACISLEDQTLAKLNAWLLGGSFGSRSATLLFKSASLASPSEGAVREKPAYKLHITYKAYQAETKLISKLLWSHGVMEADPRSDHYNILWTGNHPKPGVLRALAPHQRCNHFPRSYELTRKDRLYKNIERMQYAKGMKHFDFVPMTFVMPAEYKELCSAHYRCKGPWIVKPVASSRGRGIFIVDSPNHVPLEESVVVAKYISKPLLVDGHKCDLRLYVAVTSFDPLLVYIYEEGLVRFATVKYDATHKQLWNPCMHLCNYSINKYHSDYVKSDDPAAEDVGHKWTLSALLRYLKKQNRNTTALMAQIEDMVVKAILASSGPIVAACKMFVPYTSNCFELYGFDILIDEDLKPWLLEVNLSPSLGCDSPLDVRLKSAMLADLLTLVGVPAVDPIRRFDTTISRRSNLLRMRLGACRRVHSADGLSQTLQNKTLSSTHGPLTVNGTVCLSPEEVKLIRIARAQFERRGGFVRIFPSVDSWVKYSQYLDPVTGVPNANYSSNSTYHAVAPHNYNLVLFTHLFPDIAKLNIDLRQDCYERILKQNHLITLEGKGNTVHTERTAEVKKEVCELLRSGKRLTNLEARKVFGQYLACVLKRLTNCPDREGHSELVMKFLNKASVYLKTPFIIKTPSRRLTDKDRNAIIAMQLQEFLHMYNRETKAYNSSAKMKEAIPKEIFTLFLETARYATERAILLRRADANKCLHLVDKMIRSMDNFTKAMDRLEENSTLIALRDAIMANFPNCNRFWKNITLVSDWEANSHLGELIVCLENTRTFAPN